ncbi:MAG: ATP synthase F1 subunit gamma [Candidatus Marinimicrobia bacterium]|jgi:F-type H+-transporting ATPase subunit gamma|nr:ATP synthase F1 subunit gamma [Candidatus Neomarinimicrobiota bacterium]MBT4361420.1 ATP synthase F1 subunit gamma [Candidatus Neomarinimicrobiota bacterium]MBT4716183.1 ATP synthase F1 subunit gamma [Candidatus Neomarinimicrobiota bacterium]MBT5271180.1 ATP synthase F1 subunit gamma [Candidatus Neomarinimicrobiota bacterium]MBT6011468.1 ATP synthase F1 subunit gamma [Candidatus Neomarinimicrobiota bacterium]
MANLKDIRKRIGTIESIKQVTRAMKLVAAAKLRRAQSNMEQARPYAGRIHGVLNHLLPDIDRTTHDLLSMRPAKQKAFIILTSDRGLCGSFNSNILRQAESIIDTAGKENSKLICIGRKGYEYFGKRGYDVVEHYTDFWNELNFSHATKMARAITDRYLSGEFDDVRVIFNEFKNVAQQEIVEYHYLPLVLEDDAEEVNTDYLFEPSKDEVVKSLVPRHLNIQMWRFLLESYASEQAARMTSMEAATNNAGDLIDRLRLEYNKARQAAITTEILEVVSGAEALVE